MRAREFIYEGWGAEKQKSDAERSAQEWEAMHAKYQGDTEAETVLNLLHRGGWKAAYAEKELLGAPGAKHDKDYWLAYADKLSKNPPAKPTGYKLAEGIPVNVHALMSRGDHGSKLGWEYKASDPAYVSVDKEEVIPVFNLYFPEMFERSRLEYHFKGKVDLAIKAAKDLGFEQDKIGAWYLPVSSAYSQKGEITRAKYYFGENPKKVYPQNKTDESYELEDDIDLDEKASPKLCRSTKKLGASDQSSCVSQGLRAHQSKGKGHTDGHGRYVKGKKAKSVQYGGEVKDYDGK